jgi:amino acid transporter
MKRMKKQFLLLFILSLFLLPQATNAVSFYDPSSTLGLGSADLQATIVSVIQWILGFLGLIAVVLILYGGFTWMTAGGNEEKVEKAKKIITAAVIGLVIVLLAWAIILFALNVLTNTTT